MPAEEIADDLDLEISLETDVSIPEGLTVESLNSLVHFALESEGETGHWEIGLFLTSDNVIQDMHREYMDLDSPTDIMTFPYEPDGFMPDRVRLLGGDIVISVETAAHNAADAKWALRDELEFLVLHGILHMLGWDDPDADQRATMLARQAALLERWHNPANGR